MSTTQTSETASRTWMKGRDDYGRTVHHLYQWGQSPRAVGAVVRIPKAAADRNGGFPYLVNAWGKGEDGRGLVSYRRSLPVAKALLEEQTR